MHSEQCSNLKWVTFLHTVPLNISAHSASPPALVQTCHSRLWSKQLKVKTPKFCSMPYSGTGGQRLRKLRRSFFCCNLNLFLTGRKQFKRKTKARMLRSGRTFGRCHRSELSAVKTGLHSPASPIVHHLSSTLNLPNS